MVCDQPCSTDQGDIKGRFEILRDNTPSSVVDSGLPDTNNVRQTQSLYINTAFPESSLKKVDRKLRDLSDCINTN